jgi:hypothetical protein
VLKILTILYLSIVYFYSLYHFVFPVLKLPQPEVIELTRRSLCLMARVLMSLSTMLTLGVPESKSANDEIVKDGQGRVGSLKSPGVGDVKKQGPNQKESKSANDEIVKKEHPFWKVFNSGMNNRPRFALGLGGALAFFTHNKDVPIGLDRDSFLISHDTKSDAVGGFLHVYGKFNIIDKRRVYVALMIGYNDEVISGNKRMNIRYEDIIEHHWTYYPPGPPGPAGGDPLPEQIVDTELLTRGINVNSAIYLAIHIGTNVLLPKINKFLTIYAILGVNALLLEQYSGVKINNGTLYIRRNDYFDIYPMIGAGLELRLHDRFALKLEFTHTFIDKAMSPVFENHMYAFQALYFGHFTLGGSVYL